MTVRLLLINPKFGERFWSFKWAIEEIVPNKRAVNPPLGLATLAALCPPDWKIEIIDENIEPVPLQPLADIIGVCGMGVQFKRQTELLYYYRKRDDSCPIVFGVSLTWIRFSLFFAGCPCRASVKNCYT